MGQKCGTKHPKSTALLGNIVRHCLIFRQKKEGKIPESIVEQGIEMSRTKVGESAALFAVFVRHSVVFGVARKQLK